MATDFGHKNNECLLKTGRIVSNNFIIKNTYFAIIIEIVILLFVLMNHNAAKRITNEFQ